MRVFAVAALSAIVVACGARAEPIGVPATPIPTATPTPDPAATAAALERAVERQYVAALSDQMDRVVATAAWRDSANWGPGPVERRYTELKDEVDANAVPYRFLSCNSRIADSLAREIEAVQLQGLVDAKDAPEGADREAGEAADLATESWTLAHDECKRAQQAELPDLAWSLEAAFWRMGAVSAVRPTATPVPTPRPTVDPRTLGVVVEVTGSFISMPFTGNIGSGLTQRSVSGRTPMQFILDFDRVLGNYVAVMQKDQKSGTLRVKIHCPSGAVSQETSAFYGMVVVACPQ